MYRSSFAAAFSALTLLTGLFLAPSTAWSQRPQCMGGLPPDPPLQGVCFAEEPFVGVVYEAPLAAPEQMVVIFINDQTDDFVRAFPNGNLFVHSPERAGDMTWCPFSFSTFVEKGGREDPPRVPDECVTGTATLQANGYINRLGNFDCPYASHLKGTGLRVGDNIAFEVTSELLLVPTNQRPSGCSIEKNEIKAVPFQ
jgi:hypothetical protein